MSRFGFDFLRSLAAGPDPVDVGLEERGYLYLAPTGGAATVRAIRGARLETITGMGHDLPTGVWPTLLDLIDGHARPAPARSSDAASS